MGFNMISGRTANKFIVGLQSKQTSYDIDQTFSNITEEFNLNAHYLKEIGFIMEEWRLLHLYGIQGSISSPDYFDRAIRILDALLDLLSPKLKSYEISTYNRWIRNVEKKARELFEQREKGLFLNKTNLPKVNYIMRYVYRFLLMMLEKKGLLTKIALDPTKAIMEME